MLLDNLMTECVLRGLVPPGPSTEGRHTRSSLQSKLKQYTRDRVSQLQSLQLLSKRVRRDPAKHYYMPKRATNVNGRLVNAESRNILNYPPLRALAAPLSDVNHARMASLFVSV
jgi:hypothetical protein